MALRLIDVFQNVEEGEPGIDIAKNANFSSKVFNVGDLNWSGTDMEIGFMVIADSATTSTSVTIELYGSFDGLNFDSAIAIITTTNIADGNADFGSLNLGKPYPYIYVKATENNSNPVVNLRVVLSIPTTGGRR